MLAGREYNQKKKGLAKTLRTIGNFVKPLGKTIAPIKQALVRRGVHEIETYGAGGREDWQAEVKKMRDEHGCSLKEALSLASKARHERNGTKPKPPRTAEQKAKTKANRAARKAAKLFDELPTGYGRMR